MLAGRFLEARQRSVRVHSTIRLHTAMLTHLSSDYMIYTRGSKDDFDRLATTTGDNNWGWSSMNSYFRKVCLSYPINRCLASFLYSRFASFLVHRPRTSVARELHRPQRCELADQVCLRASRFGRTRWRNPPASGP